MPDDQGRNQIVDADLRLLSAEQIAKLTLTELRRIREELAKMNARAENGGTPAAE